MNEIKIIDKTSGKVTIEVHDDCVVIKRSESVADKINYNPHYGGVMECTNLDGVARVHDLKSSVIACGSIGADVLSAGKTCTAAPVSREEEAAVCARNAVNSVKAVVEHSIEKSENTTVQSPDTPANLTIGNLACNASDVLPAKTLRSISETAERLKKLIQELCQPETRD